MQVVEDSDIIPIEPMQNAHAFTLIRTKLRGIKEDDDSIAKLATALDDMPLTSSCAGSFVHSRTSTKMLSAAVLRKVPAERQQRDKSVEPRGGSSTPGCCSR
jgi:hypothetical protein